MSIHKRAAFGFAVMVVLGGFGCGGSSASMRGVVSVDRDTYDKGQNVNVTIKVSEGAVGTFLRIQKQSGGSWVEVANFNPENECPEMQERPGGGFTFITKRPPMCRQVESDWKVAWLGTISKQCVKAGSVDEGTYRICVARFVKKCIMRKGRFGFERPRGASTFICSRPFQIR